MKRNYRAPLEPITTIVIPEGRNEYGFRINISHKAIAPLYEAWMIANGIHPRCGNMTVGVRARFESFVLEAIDTYGENVEDYLEYQLDYLRKQNKKSAFA